VTRYNDDPVPGEGSGPPEDDGIVQLEGTPYEVVSYPADWDSVRQTLGAQYCGRLRLRGITRGDGRVFSMPVACDSWTHQECATRRARLVLRAIERLWRHGMPLWLTSFRDDAATFIRLRQRRSGCGDDYLVVHRTDGWVHVLATAERPGRKEPTCWAALDRTEGMYLLASQVLRLPGISKVRWSDAWQPSQRSTSTGEYAIYGIFNDEIWALILQDAVRRVVFRYGIDPWNPEEEAPPKLVESWDWTLTVTEVIKQWDEEGKI